MLLQPRQERAEHPLGQSAIGAVTGGGGKRLLDLVDPQDHRGHHLRLAHGLAQVPLGFADEARVQCARVQAKQGLLPAGGDRLGAEALACSLHAEHEHALGRHDAERLRLGTEDIPPVREPFLETAHPADLAQVERGLDVFEQAALLDHPPLVGDDDIDVVVVEALIGADGVGDDPHGLAARQSPQVADNRIESPLRDADLDGLFSMESLQRGPDDLLQLLLVGEGNLE
jgi:hypothetical protein